MRRLGTSLALLAVSAVVVAQQGGPAYWEARYGPISNVSVDDLVRDSFAYEDRGVTTTGHLQQAMGASQLYLMRGAMGGYLAVLPMSEIAYNWERDARELVGRNVEVTGVFQSNDSRQRNQPAGVLQIWEYTGPPREPTADELHGAAMSLEDLVTRVGDFDGKTVQVVGKFRGRNLFGDLPGDSQRRSEDWVIKDDLFAVWVISTKPKGDGFELDPKKKRDTSKWLEVIGKVETARGITYIRAHSVALTRAPKPSATAQAVATPTPRPRKPPVVVFTLPLEGEPIPSNGLFTVQFSKDMVVESFEGRVALRYAGPTLPGDRPFDGVLLSYDGGRRALTVDPGDILRPGRVVELWFLDGIEDIEGLTLVPRDELVAATERPDAVDVLRYRVGG